MSINVKNNFNCDCLEITTKNGSKIISAKNGEIFEITVNGKTQIKGVKNV